MAHGVMKPFSMLLEPLVVVEVEDHLEAVEPKLVVEEPVGGLDREEDSHQVEGLPEGEAELVAVVLVAVVDELVRNFLGLAKFPSLGLIVLLLSTSSVSSIFLLLSTSLLLILATTSTSSSAGSNLDPVLIPVLFSPGEDVTDQLVFKIFFPD